MTYVVQVELRLNVIFRARAILNEVAFSYTHTRKRKKFSSAAENNNKVFKRKVTLQKAPILAVCVCVCRHRIASYPTSHAAMRHVTVC